MGPEVILRTMSTKKNKKATGRLWDLLNSLGGFVLLGLLIVMALDFFDVGVFDGKGPGAAIICLGIGLLSVAVDGWRTGVLDWGRGAISREPIPALFWIVLTIYVLAAITMIVVGALTLGPFASLN